jgi:hypothetical protein
MGRAVGCVNGFFSASNFNGLRMAGMAKTPEINSELAGDLPVKSMACA